MSRCHGHGSDAFLYACVIGRTITSGALLGLGGFIGGCQAPPRAHVDSAAVIADAAGLAAPVEFRSVGVDGGPVDEPDAAGASLTLADSIRRAVTRDPGLQAAMARIRMAIADSDQARLIPNPVLNIALRWGPGRPQIEASLAQDFVQALQMPRRVSAADHRLGQSAADAVTVALDVTSEVQERYAAAQASAALVPLLQERLELLDRLAATAKARLDAGEGARGDAAVFYAQQVELRVELDRARLTEREERLRLARLIGEPSSVATWTLDRWSTPLIPARPESDWVDAGLRHRPEIQAIVWRLMALGDDEATLRLWPWESASLGVDAQRDDRLFAGPSVSTPIPAFDMGQARRARLTAEQLEARHDLTRAKRKVVEEVRIAFQVLEASRRNLQLIHNELIPLQQQRRQLAEDAYRAGHTDVIAIFLAEHDLRVAQAQLIDVERQAAGALVRLRRAVGGQGVAASVSSAMPSDPAEPSIGAQPAASLDDQTSHVMRRDP